MSTGRASACPSPAAADQLEVSSGAAGPRRRHASLQYFTASQVRSHRLRQVMGLPQATQGLLGKCCLLPLKPRGVAVIPPLSTGQPGLYICSSVQTLVRNTKVIDILGLSPMRSFFGRQVGGGANPASLSFLPFEPDTSYENLYDLSRARGQPDCCDRICTHPPAPAKELWPRGQRKGPK